MVSYMTPFKILYFVQFVDKIFTSIPNAIITQLLFWTILSLYLFIPTIQNVFENL